MSLILSMNGLVNMWLLGLLHSLNEIMYIVSDSKVMMFNNTNSKEFREASAGTERMHESRGR